MVVQFTNMSTNSPTSWYWDFGDETTLTAKNPSHKYTNVGKHTVSLTVKGDGGSNIKKIRACYFCHLIFTPFNNL
ncbi:PKD domain-containing protein [Methanosarcina sp. Z-7115]|uniref:PKD domain-containing protein n=1 Tax=Methanosarcina baikalica TaxID=3073890 RepID=A0ABU2D4U6_9EURY|nr:PKD domain-containing protein [Methanosarcina sp. Z-7115]MDR7666867.1 PKD domain-containing protein [Methanosarcina sp. Z-7115]